MMNRHFAIGLAGLLTCGTATTPASDNRRDHETSAGAVYTMNNSPAGNAILIFQRSGDGMLSPAGSIATGGLGTGTGLGNQGALLLSKGGRWLFACNPGSNEISVFERTPWGLVLSDKVGSEGTRPISLALHRNLLYVLNAGDPGAGVAANLTAFLFWRGQLWHGTDSTRNLSEPNPNPAQISFTRDGGALVVTEKATDRISTFTLDDDGIVDQQRVYASSGPTPFGFASG